MWPNFWLDKLYIVHLDLKIDATDHPMLSGPQTLISKVWPTVCCGSVLLYPTRRTYSVLTCSSGLAHGPHQRKLPITLQALLHIHISTTLKHREIKSTLSVNLAFRHPSFSLPLTQHLCQSIFTRAGESRGLEWESEQKTSSPEAFKEKRYMEECFEEVGELHLPSVHEMQRYASVCNHVESRLRFYRVQG